MALKLSRKPLAELIRDIHYVRGKFGSDRVYLYISLQDPDMKCILKTTGIESVNVLIADSVKAYL